MNFWQRRITSLVLLTFVVSSTFAIKTIPLLAPGDPTDLDWSYALNNGRVDLERRQNVQTLLYKWVTANPPTFAATKPGATPYLLGEILNNTDYDLVITGDFSFNVAVGQAASIYPDRHYLHLDLNPQLLALNLSNVKVVKQRSEETYFLGGFLAGLMTKSNLIGFVSTVFFPESIRIQNAFYFGAKLANPNATIYQWYTNSFIDQDVAAASARNLSALGVDIIMLSIDGYGVHQLGAQLGFLSIGTVTDNGSFQGTPNVISSAMFDMSVSLEIVYLQLINGQWNQPSNLSAPAGTSFYSPNVFYGSLANGGVKMAPLAPSVPQSVAKRMADMTQAIVNGSYGIFCGWRAYASLPNGTKPGDPGECINFDQYVNMATPVNFPDMIYLGTYVIPLVEDPVLSSGIKAFLYTIGGISLGISLVTLALVIIFRSRAVLHYSSPLFCVLIICGAIIATIGAILWIPDRTQANCILAIWLPNLGFALIVANLFVKTWRLWALHQASKKFRTLNLPNHKILIISSAIVGFDIALMFMWTFIQMTDVETPSSGVPYHYYSVCKIPTAGIILLAILIAYKAILVVIACYASFRGRQLGTVFDESSAISLACYNLGFCLALLVPIFFVATNYEGQYIIIILSIIIVSTLTILLLFVPKFWILLRQQDGSQQFKKYVIKSMGSSTVSSTSKAESLHTNTHTNTATGTATSGTTSGSQADEKSFTIVDPESAKEVTGGNYV